jgi:glycosyltransferase involved in cell wall biosynthesis
MLRVVHVPGRTPYARKLRNAAIRVINDTAADGLGVPRDLTLAWLLDHQPWDWFDVMHLHHLDFEPIVTLEAALIASRRAGKRIVATVHDTGPIFGHKAAHRRRMQVLMEHHVPLVSLTSAAAAEVAKRFGAQPVVLPHGYVAEPGTGKRSMPRCPGPTRFMVYGSLRSNRDVELVLHCWRFARDLRETVLHLLLRAPSRASLAAEAEIWRVIREHSADPRLVVEVLPFPTDQEVSDAMAAADCLVLPYRWASHSGQLEHAFDLGVLPVAANVGYLPDQVSVHADLVDRPTWFDWADGTEFAYGERLLDAMRRAHERVQNGWQAKLPDRFAEHRRAEHSHLLAAHQSLYTGDPSWGKR